MFIITFKVIQKMSSLPRDIIAEAYITLLILANFDLVIGEISTVHKTREALLNKKELSCYQCDTMIDGERCANLSIGNKTQFIRKCNEDSRVCMVRRFSYTTSNENSTSVLRLWALQRNCSSRCEPGCIIIGERTKLYSCVSCCYKNRCNQGKAGSHSKHSNCFLILLALLVYYRDN